MSHPGFQFSVSSCQPFHGCQSALVTINEPGNWRLTTKNALFAVSIVSPHWKPGTNLKLKTGNWKLTPSLDDQ
jgi:hypothetical protein